MMDTNFMSVGMNSASNNRNRKICAIGDENEYQSAALELCLDNSA
jgi:hypothetical protein